MSKISEISRQYHSALSESHDQYERLYKERVEAVEDFYRDFFHQLICDYGSRFNDERFRKRLQDHIERKVGTNKLQFIAIDGTCRRELFSDFITFFGGAYGARGEVELTGGDHLIQYKRWSLDHDVSMVAWVPVPFSRMEEVLSSGGEDFLVTEEERINLSSVHVRIMQLAEFFLAYNTIRSSRLDAPNILLMDLSPSSVLASVAHSQERIGLVGYPYDRRELTKADISIALSHPYSEHFSIPSAKRMDYHRILLAELNKAPGNPLDISSIAQKYGITVNDLRYKCEGLVDREILNPADKKSTLYHPSVRVDESWAYTRELFQNICTRLFLKKDPGALQYDVKNEDGTTHRRWMSPDDIEFLIGVGMRLLIEECWERNILFYGIVKDSMSRYLTRNFFGVSLETGFYPELKNLKVSPLPWTDRIFCEIIPLIDEDMQTPWSTIEFDSAFMTLHRERNENSGKTAVAGIMGRIVNQEHLFAKSLGQFYLKRDKPTPLMGHVVFLERLLSPMWDVPGSDSGPSEMKIDTDELGSFSAYAWRDRDHTNLGQQVMMYLLSVLTRNHFAEAIGYPDPLHKADWGAKTIGRSVAETLKSSTKFLASRPLSRTFRDIRDSKKR